MATKLENEAKKQLKEQEKEQKAALKAEQKLLKEQEKADKVRAKAGDKVAQQLAKQEAKEAKKGIKNEKDLKNQRVKVLLSRSKVERKPAKIAARAIAKERNPSQALKKIQRVRKNFMDLPPVLWPLMLVVSYIWAKNTWEKERQQRDLKEARRFLKETRDIK